MPNLDDRVGTLEERMDHQASMLTDIRGEVRQIHRRFEEIDRRFSDIDRRFEQIDHRFEQIDRRFEQIDRRFEFMDQKMDRHFVWLVGIMATGFISMVGALVGIAYK